MNPKGKDGHMKTYTQDEWTEIVNKSRGGTLHIDGVNIGKDLTIEYLRTTTKLSGTLEAWGSITADGIREITGRKQFSYTVGEGVSLVVDADETIKFKPTIPEGIVNPKTIPFKTWIADYIKSHNAEHKRNEDKIYNLEIVGCEVNHKGIVRALNARVTWGVVYGQFGRLTTDKSLEISRDVLWGTYCMSRDLLDDWTPNCFGDHYYHAYFTDGFDIVFADDGKYQCCRNPPPTVETAA